MPAHDWTRVSAGTFHDFHCSWIPEMKNRLNRGILPADYYAQVEQIASDTTPDVRTLREVDGANDSNGSEGVGTAVALAPPRVRYTAVMEITAYAARRREIVIRHSSDDRVIAIIEVLSPGNKSGRTHFQQFVDKAVNALIQGIHLVLIDLFPPTKRDPEGVHGALAAELGNENYNAPSDKPLTLASYASGSPTVAYVEPFAVGDLLTDMPLFLTTKKYVPVPLEESYQVAFLGVPKRWRSVLEQTIS